MAEKKKKAPKGAREPKGLTELRKLGVMVVSLSHLRDPGSPPAWGVRMPDETVYLEAGETLTEDLEGLLKRAQECRCPACGLPGPHTSNVEEGWGRAYKCRNRKCGAVFEF